MIGVLALYAASAKEFVRDRVAMFFTLLLPVMFALSSASSPSACR